MKSDPENAPAMPSPPQGHNADSAFSQELSFAKSLLAALPNFAFLVDRQHRYLHVSEIMSRLLNRPPAEIVGKTMRELGVPEEHAARREAKRQRVFDTGEPVTEILVSPFLAQNAIFEYTYAPIRSANGTVEALLCIAKDITEQQKAQDALRRSENRYRALAEAVAQLIWTTDAAGRGDYASDSWMQFTGQTLEQSADWGWLNAVHPDDRESVRQAWQQTEITQAPYETRYRLRRADGAYRDIVARGFPVRSETGQIVEWIGTCDDVTDALRAEVARQQAESERQALQDTMYAILDNAPATISFKDLEGHYLFLNRMHERVHKKSREEAIGKTNFDLFGLDHAVPAQEQDRYVIETGEIWSDEVQMVLDDGPHTYYSFKFPLRDAAGNIYATCGIATDITDRKHLEAQLYQSQKMEGIGRLAGGIAHDFNNLLTAIIGYAELAEMDVEPDSPIVRHLQTVQQAAQSAAALTRQLLAFARKQMLDTQVFSLNALIVETDKMLRRVIGEDVEFVTLTQPDLGFVRADANQITQVLINLAVNARDAMPDGGRLTIETGNVTLDENYARLHAEVQPGPYVMLSVGDTGTGMSEDVKAHLFEPFFTTKGPGKGTGLGLATCYGIVKQNGGHIWLYSEPGQGSTFKVYLPRVDGPAAALRRPDVSTTLPTGSETILIAEDEPVLRTLAAEILTAQGYRVLTATNGTDALRAAGEAAEIHLLITDVVMPYMGGEELAQLLLSARPGVRVLYVSGYTENAIVQHGILNADIHFLQKPYLPAALARKVRDVLDEKAH